MTGRKGSVDMELDRGALRIMEALSGVDEALLERCERKNKIIDYRSQLEYRKRRTDGRYSSLWKYSKSWAAVLCLAVVGTVSWGGYKLTKGVRDQNASGSCNNEMAPLQSVAIEDTVYEAEDAVTAGAQEEYSTQGESFAGLNGAAADTDSGAGDNTAQASGQLAEPTERNQETVKEQQAVGEQKKDQTGEQENKYEMESVSELPHEEIPTEADARAVEKLGDYVPTALPGGYVFERAFSDLNREDAAMSVYWSRGMDSIGLYIVEEKEKPVTVDVSRPETYDERLYEIPYAESVPAEYREVFHNPVFAVEDFSLEIVKSRMISYEDSGDTDISRGNFSVLYPNGVVVRFNGRGTAEEIWELFASIRGE